MAPSIASSLLGMQKTVCRGRSIGQALDYHFEPDSPEWHIATAYIVEARMRFPEAQYVPTNRQYSEYLVWVAANEALKDRR